MSKKYPKNTCKIDTRLKIAQKSEFRGKVEPGVEGWRLKPARWVAENQRFEAQGGCPPFLWWKWRYKKTLGFL